MIEKFQESQQSLTEPQKLIHAARGSSESDLITAGSVNEDSSYFSQDCIIVDEPHTLAGIYISYIFQFLFLVMFIIISGLSLSNFSVF